MGFALIERYVFRKAAISVAVSAIALISVLWVVQAVRQVDVLLNKGQGIITYLKMSSLGVPTLAAAILPMALLIGLIQTINTLNDDSELVVMHASGASRGILLKPFISLSLVISVLVMILHLWASPLSMQTLREYVTKMRADLVSVIVQEGRFRSVGKGVVFHVASRAPGGLLKGIFIHDNRAKDQIFTYLAKEGAVSEIDNRSYLILDQGQIHRRDTKSGQLSIIKFNSYAFNLSDFSTGKTRRNVSQLELSTFQLLFPDKNSDYYKHDPGGYRSELHTRLTGGLYPVFVGLLLLAFIGNPTSHRQERVLTVLTACTFIVGLRGITVYAEGALRFNPHMIYFVWGLPLAGIALACFLLVTDREAMPTKWLSHIEDFLERLVARLLAVRNRLIGSRMSAGDAP